VLFRNYPFIALSILINTEEQLGYESTLHRKRETVNYLETLDKKKRRVLPDVLCPFACNSGDRYRYLKMEVVSWIG